MRQSRWMLLLILVIVPAVGAQNFVLPTTDRSSFVVQKNIAYDEGLKLDFYRPAGNAVVPVMIFCNVGNAGMKDWAGYVGWGEAVAAGGLAAIHYDAANGRGFESLDRVVAWARANGEKLRIDPSRIVLWGGSSNVQIALPAAMDRNRDYVKGAVIYYGNAEVKEIRTDLPLLFIRAGLDSPWLNGEIDKILVRALSANAPWTIENYGGGLHGFDILNDNDVSREMIRRTIEFARRVTAEPLTRAYQLTAADAALGAKFNAGDWKASVEGYSARVKENPNDAESHRKLAVALYELNRPAEALTEFEEAWRLGRRGPRDTGFPAARAAAKAGNIDRALHWIEIVTSTPFVSFDDVRNDPAFAGVVESERFRKLSAGIDEQRRIDAMITAGNAAAAVSAIRSSGEGRLRSEAALNSLGYRLLSAGHTKEALEVFTLAVENHPRSANAWDSRSEAWERAGDRRRALEDAAKALAIDGSGPAAEASKARIERLRAEGQKAEGRRQR
jgi:tetratricopeptide (TPR) repeat protein